MLGNKIHTFQYNNIIIMTYQIHEQFTTKYTHKKNKISTEASNNLENIFLTEKKVLWLEKEQKNVNSKHQGNKFCIH